jgi:prepilin-type N-terminal cleavage/methylation domain-containing protein
MQCPTTLKMVRRRAFTLYELLLVMAIISLLASFSASSVTSLTTTGNLNHSVEAVTRSAVAARQTAMSSGQPVAMAVAMTGNNGILLLKGESDAAGTMTWTPSGAWERIPDQIGMGVFPRDGMDSFYANSGSQSNGLLSGELPTKMNGKGITEYSYIVFRPDGSVDAPAKAPSLTLKRLSKADKNDDYIILVSENSGRCKVIEP